MAPRRAPAGYDERRREVLARLHARRHELAHELVGAYRSVITEYRELPESVLSRDVFEVAVRNIEHLVGTFEDGFEVSEQDQDWLFRSAARRVHQQVSLPSLLRTFRLWGNHLWRSMAELAGDDDVGRQLTIDAADGVMAYVDQVSLGVSRAYEQESAEVASDERTLRTDVLETLLSGEPVNERARRQVALLNMTLRQRLLVVVVRTTDRARTPQAVRDARELLAPLAKVCLVGARGAEVVCICSAESGAEATALERAAHSLAAGLGLVVGIGRAHPHLDGVRRSYAEARDAARLGAAARPGRAVRFPDVLLDQVLQSIRPIDALLEETVQPLVEYDARKGAGLLLTLRAYVAARSNLTHAAEQLSVSPNTVVYRLRRIHTLTGWNPSDVDDLLLLTLGLRLHDSSPPLH